MQKLYSLRARNHGFIVPYCNDKKDFSFLRDKNVESLQHIKRNVDELRKMAVCSPVNRLGQWQ